MHSHRQRIFIKTSWCLDSVPAETTQPYAFTAKTAKDRRIVFSSSSVKKLWSVCRRLFSQRFCTFVIWVPHRDAYRDVSFIVSAQKEHLCDFWCWKFRILFSTVLFVCSFCDYEHCQRQMNIPLYHRDFLLEKIYGKWLNWGSRRTKHRPLLGNIVTDLTKCCIGKICSRDKAEVLMCNIMAAHPNSHFAPKNCVPLAKETGKFPSWSWQVPVQYASTFLGWNKIDLFFADPWRH